MLASSDFSNIVRAQIYRTGLSRRSEAAAMYQMDRRILVVVVLAVLSAGCAAPATHDEPSPSAAADRHDPSNEVLVLDYPAGDSAGLLVPILPPGEDHIALAIDHTKNPELIVRAYAFLTRDGQTDFTTSAGGLGTGSFALGAGNYYLFAFHAPTAGKIKVTRWMDESGEALDQLFVTRPSASSNWTETAGAEVSWFDQVAGEDPRAIHVEILSEWAPAPTAVAAGNLTIRSQHASPNHGLTIISAGVRGAADASTHEMRWSNGNASDAKRFLSNAGLARFRAAFGTAGPVRAEFTNTGAQAATNVDFEVMTMAVDLAAHGLIPPNALGTSGPLRSIPDVCVACAASAHLDRSR